MSYGSRKRGTDQGGCVRGVDLRFRRIMSNPSQTLRRRLVRTTHAAVSARLDACRGSSRLYFSHFATRTVDNTVDLYAYEAINSSRIAFFTYHTYIRRPRHGGFPSEYRHPVWHGKTRMAWLPDGEKISKIFIHFDATHERDGHTDRQTHTA